VYPSPYLRLPTLHSNTQPFCFCISHHSRVGASAELIWSAGQAAGQLLSMSRNLFFRGSDLPCEYCGQWKPERTNRLLLSCCRLPGCKENLCSLCYDCMWNLFECFQLSERAPHDNEKFHVWLFHHMSCRNERQ
jgi:hypothetical protein